MKRTIRTLLDLSLLTAIILLTAYGSGLLTGNPKGIDTYAYLTKIRLILEHFPYINWNPYWDSGTPFSIWSYPPAAMVIASALVRFLGISAGEGLTILAAVCFVLLGWGIYGFIYQVTKVRLAGILTVIVLVSSPASWSWWNGGNFVRVFGLGMTGVALFFNVYYLHYLTRNDRRKFLYVLAVLSFALGLMSHLLLGGVVSGLVLLLYLFSDLPRSRKLKEFSRLFLPAFALAAYWYLPLLFTGKPAARFFGRDPAFPIPWSNFFSPQFGEENFSLSTAVVIFLGLAGLLLALAALLKKGQVSRFQKGVIAAFLTLGLGSLLYNILGFLPFYPKAWYIVGFPPITAFSLFGIVVVILGGLILGVAVKRFGRVVSFSALTLISLIVIIGAIYDSPSLKEAVDDVIAPGSLQSLSQQVIKVNYPDNYRFGTDSAFVADWFTWKYETYQTRDYFGQGITYPDWQNWFETAVWYWEGNYPETKFLLDWYGVREFFVGNPHFKYYKFLDQDGFRVENQQTLIWSADSSPLPYYQFEYTGASEIFSARNTPVVLVIGRNDGYNYFLRSLAKTGLDSRRLIPIRGGEKIDDFSSEELANFDGIILYEYSYRSKSRALDLLKNYLQRGKTIIWETHASPQSTDTQLPDLLPVKRLTARQIWDNWQVQAGEGLIEGSRILQEDGGVPLVAAWETGGGKVVWSGLNLPYLILDRKSTEGTALMEKILTQEFVKSNEVETSFLASFPNPEKREIRLSTPARGVLLKESYFANWQAKIGGKKARIYPAGPDLMYVFVPPGQTEVVFKYHLSLLEKASWLISLLTLIVLLVYAVEGKIIKAGLIRKMLFPLISSGEKTSRTIRGWWEKEDEV